LHPRKPEIVLGMIYLPFLGALAEATGMTLEKIILRVKKVNYKNYTVYGFLAIVLVMLPFIYFFWNVSPQAYELKNILILAGVLAASITANLLIFYAFKRESLSEIEPIRLMQPLFVILLAVTLFPAERQLTIVGLALVASIALVGSHIKKHHFVYDKYMVAALLGSFFFALELVISRAILDFYNPFTFYFIRCLFVFIITLVIFRPKDHFKNKTKAIMLLAGGIWVINRLILYWGFIELGIVFTTMLFIISPIFIYIFAKIFLKEKITWRHIISSIIIIACVVAALMLGN